MTLVNLSVQCDTGTGKKCSVIYLLKHEQTTEDLSQTTQYLNYTQYLDHTRYLDYTGSGKGFHM